MMNSIINPLERLQDHTGPMKGVLYCRSHDGKESMTQNAVIYGGRRFTLESILDVPSKQNQTLSLNRIFKTKYPDILREPGFEDDYATPKRRKVCLIGVGTGGSGLLWGSVKDPNGNNLNLSEPIPMRTIPHGSELSDEDKKKYFFETNQTIKGNRFKTYYLKLISSVEVVTAHDGKRYEPKSEDIEKTEDPSETLCTVDAQIYAEIKFSIELQDIKEYFRALENQSIKNARFSELGLYFGTLVEQSGGGTGKKDFINIEAFSRVTFNNKGMETDGSFYDFAYYLID